MVPGTVRLSRRWPLDWEHSQHWLTSVENNRAAGKNEVAESDDYATHVEEVNMYKANRMFIVVRKNKGGGDSLRVIVVIQWSTTMNIFETPPDERWTMATLYFKNKRRDASMDYPSCSASAGYNDFTTLSWTTSPMTSCEWSTCIIIYILTSF